MKQNVKIFSHNDLDGVGCPIVARAYYGKENVDITYCGYHDVNEKVMDFLTSGKFYGYDHVFITDISVNELVAQQLDTCRTACEFKLTLLDHHETAECLNKYEWAHVHATHKDGTNTSGTSMLFDYLNQPSGYDGLVELIRRYDSWDWHNIYHDDTAKKLNDLFYTYGRDRFIEKAEACIEENGFFVFDDTDLIILELKEEEIQRYIEKSQKRLTIMNVGRYNIGVVFGEQFISEVCHALHKLNPNLDLIAMVNMNSRKISYRTDREDINVGNLAKYFGGGGRKQTAGSEISDTLIDSILNKILE